MMANFVKADRDTDYLFPPSMQDWLPQDHLARFVVEVVDQLDLSELTRQCRAGFTGSSPRCITQLADLWLRDRGIFQPQD